MEKPLDKVYHKLIKIGGMERIERVVVMLSTSEKKAAKDRAGLASLSAWVRSLILRETNGGAAKKGKRT